jgi:hypothetical protein
MKYYLTFNSGIGFGAIMSIVLGVPDTTSEIVTVWLAFVVSGILAFFIKN